MKTILTLLVIQVIPYKQMRYQTAGDWYQKGGVTYIVVAKMSDPRYEKLLAIHELVECWLCQNHGVTEKQVDDFDMSWREHDGLAEPGDDPKAPYHKEHKIASKVERIMAVALGINWKTYNDEVDSL